MRGQELRARLAEIIGPMAKPGELIPALPDLAAACGVKGSVIPHARDLVLTELGVTVERIAIPHTKGTRLKIVSVDGERYEAMKAETVPPRACARCGKMFERDSRTLTRCIPCRRKGWG